MRKYGQAMRETKVLRRKKWNTGQVRVFGQIQIRRNMLFSQVLKVQFVCSSTGWAGPQGEVAPPQESQQAAVAPVPSDQQEWIICTWEFSANHTERSLNC